MLVGLFLHQQGNGIGKRHNKGQCRRQKAHGVAKGQGEHAVCGHILVVDKTHKIQGAAAACGKRVLHHQHKGDGVEQQAAQKQRADQQPALQGGSGFFHQFHS